MTITQRTVGSVVVLRLAGGLARAAGAGAVKKRVTTLIEEEGARWFVLSLAEVPYVDSSGVGELVSAFITVRNKGGAIRLAGASPRIKEILTIARLDTVFELFDTEDAALDGFAGASPT